MPSGLPPNTSIFAKNGQNTPHALIFVEAASAKKEQNALDAKHISSLHVSPVILYQ